jgi:hypothetical protein
MILVFASAVILPVPVVGDPKVMMTPDPLIR